MNTQINISLPHEVEAIITRIMELGGQAYVVGGAIRDAILGRPITDWDIATSLQPNEIENLFSYARTIPTGKRYGTVTVVINNVPVQVTTFRGEGQYSDFRHPHQVTFLSDIVEDLSRRDFTINALAYNPYLHKPLLDPFSGLNDLKQKIVRTVGQPGKRFSEDPLRIMRGIRFCAELGFQLEQQTLDAACTYHYLLSQISTERIRDELNRILLAPAPLYALMLLHQTGVFKIILPEVFECFNRSLHFPCQNQNIRELIFNTINICKPDIVLRLAALYYGIGKSFNDKPNHPKNGCTIYQSLDYNTKIVELSLKRLRYDSKTVRRVLSLVSHTPICFNSNKIEAAYQLRKLMGIIGIEDTFRLLELKQAYFSAAGQKQKSASVNQYKQIALEIVSRGDALTLSQLAINGNDILDIGIGIDDRRDVGRALHQAYEWVLMHPEWNEKQFLLSKLKTTFNQQNNNKNT